MLEEILKIAEYTKQNAILNSNDYIENDLLFCGNCNTPKQTKIKTMGREIIVNCDCQCMIEQYEQQQQQFKDNQHKVFVNQCKSGILEKEMLTWTFKNDNGSNPQLMTLCKRYVSSFEQMVNENIGVLFTGDVGRGKTFAAACIANALINQGHRVLMTNFSQIINDMQDFSTGNNNEYIQQLNNYELLVIDDFGVERKTQTALQYMEDVIDSRFTSKKPIIITTNLSTEEIDNPKVMEYKRMCSRIKGMTITFSVNGADKRSELKQDKLSKFKTMLGGN